MRTTTGTQNTTTTVMFTRVSRRPSRAAVVVFWLLNYACAATRHWRACYLMNVGLRPVMVWSHAESRPYRMVPLDDKR